MNGRTKIVSSVLLGVGAWFVTNYVCNAIQKRELLAKKKLKREATQEWEGEGGSIIDQKPVPAAAS